MEAQYIYKKRFLLAIVFAFALSVSFSLYAQTTIPSAKQAALEDLSTAVGKQISTAEEAHTLCNSEQFLTTCAEIGKRHDLFTSQELPQVEALLADIKGGIEKDLKACTTDECLIGVAKQLASKVLQKNPKLAQDLDLTLKKVEEKQAVVQVANEAGIDFKACRELDPDTAPVGQLRACAKLLKDPRVARQVSTQVKEAASHIGNEAQLREALSKGEVQCGNNTLEGCGNFCLNPSAQGGTGGTSAIPPVCRQIAERFFGSEGVKSLEEAYTGVGRAADYYNKKAETIVFTTQDGKTLTDPAEFGRYMEGQGKAGNLEAVQKGMDFMVAHGFARPEDKDFALKMVGKFKEQGGLKDFDACQKDPQSCAGFVPEEFRSNFDEVNKVQDVMQQELGFNPQDCGRSSSDESVRSKCFEAAKRALPKLEALNVQSPETKRMISEIKSHASDQNVQDNVRAVVEREGGPGGCKSGQDCRAYCSDSAHGPECLSFGSKLNVFRKEDVVQHYQDFNAHLQGPQFGPPQQGSSPGFVPPDQQGGFGGPGQQGGSGPQGGFGGGQGPNPMCLAAIQSGDFARAKEVCFVPPTPAFQPLQPTNSGTEPQSKPGQVCPGMPTVSSCPPDQERVLRYSSPECGEYYACQPKQSAGYHQCPSDQYWFVPPGGSEGAGYCKPSGSAQDPATGCTQHGGTWTGTYCKMPGAEDPSVGCARAGGAWMDTYCKMPNQAPPPPGTPPPGDSAATGCAQAGGAWMGTYCKMPTMPPPPPGTPPPSSTTCSSGQYWNGSSCVTSTMPPPSSTSCPSGQYWYMPPGGTAGYCQSTSTTPPPSSTTCSSGQYWNGSSCVTSTMPPPPPGTPPPPPMTDPATGCSQYGGTWNGTTCVMPSTPPPPPPGTTPPPPPPSSTTCSSGQYWNGSSCVTSTMPPPPPPPPPPGGTPTPPPPPPPPPPTAPPPSAPHASAAPLNLILANLANSLSALLQTLTNR